MFKCLYLSPAGRAWKLHWQHHFKGTLFRTKKEAWLAAERRFQEDEGSFFRLLIRKANGQFQHCLTYAKAPLLNLL